MRMKQLICCVDVELFCHTEYARRHGINPGKDIVQELHWLINLFDELNFRTTFFIVGLWADRHKELVVLISDRGHEVAAHSMHHRSYQELSVAEMKQDVYQSVDCIRQITGKKIKGFRNPSWQMHGDMEAFYEALADNQVVYSSSMLPWKGMFGIRGETSFGERPHLMYGKVLEVPVSMGTLAGIKIPFSLSTCLRVLPEFISHHLIMRHVTLNQFPLLLNIHPWDIQPDSPQWFFGDLLFGYLTYNGRHRFKNKFRNLVQHQAFMTLEMYVESYLGAAHPC